MYLWSIDIEAVLVAMSCFSLLCEEAEIRGGSDDVTVLLLLPNVHVYQELALASTVVTTGKSQLHYSPTQEINENILFFPSDSS